MFSQKCDADEVKRAHSIQSELDSMGIDYSQDEGQLRLACPIHGGKNPNFVVNTVDNTFYCHSKCGKGGSIIDFLMDLKNLSAIGALKELKNRGANQPYHPNTETRSEGLKAPSKVNPKGGDNDNWLAIWDNSIKSSEANTSQKDLSYFELKGVKPPKEIRFHREYKSPLIPYRDIDGNLKAAQSIYENKEESGGKWKKRFLRGSSPKSAFFTVKEGTDNGTVYIAEGVATACTIAEVLHYDETATVLATGSSNNMTPTAKAFRDKYPDRKIVACLDHDRAGIGAVKDLTDIPDLWFRLPTTLDKDFNDIHLSLGLGEVSKQLDIDRSISEIMDLDSSMKSKNKSGDLDRDFTDILESYEEEGQCKKEVEDDEKARVLSRFLTSQELESHYSKASNGIDIGLKVHGEEILLPTGAFTTIVAPTKHGKTLSLVNWVHSAFKANNDLEIMFITLEESSKEIACKILNRQINIELSRNNIRSLRHYLGHQNSEDRFRMFSSKHQDIDLFEQNRTKEDVDRKFNDFKHLLNSDRLLILSPQTNSIEEIKQIVKETRKHKPKVKMVVIDYLQLVSTKSGNRSRDEMLKEVCMQVKDLAIEEDISILTASQFNRTVLNEDCLMPSAIGEAAAIERTSALVLGMWNRNFQQFDGVGKKRDLDTKKEIIFHVMLNRGGSSGQRFLVPFNGNCGLVDFGNVEELDGTRQEEIKFEREVATLSKGILQ